MRPSHPASPDIPADTGAGAGWLADGAAPATDPPAGPRRSSSPFPLGLSRIETMRRAHEARGMRIGHGAGRLFRIALAALCIALVLRLAVVERIAVSDAAMAPAMTAGDIVLVDKAAYGWSVASLPAPVRRILAAGLAVGEGTPHATGQRLMARPARRGDILVFAAGPAGNGTRIGRVVAVAGERVAIRDGRIVLDGVALACRPIDRTQCRERIGGREWRVLTGSAGLQMAETLVPPGHQLVVGDNRTAAGAAAGLPALVADARLIGRVRHVLEAPAGAPWRKASRGT